MHQFILVESLGVPNVDDLAQKVNIEMLVNQIFATSATDQQLKIRLVKNIQALIAQARQQQLQADEAEFRKIIGTKESHSPILNPNLSAGDQRKKRHRNDLRDELRTALTKLKDRA